MDKEKVKNYLKNYFFPITSASQEEWRGMYRGAIEYGYLHYEGDLTEWERKQQWEEFDRLMQLERTPVVVAAIRLVGRDGARRLVRGKLRADEICLTNKTKSPSEPAGVKATRTEYGKDQ